MNKIGILRNIHNKLRYKTLDELIGLEISVDFNTTQLHQDIEDFARVFLKMDVTLLPQKTLHMGILKYGLLDLRFEINDNIDYPQPSGIDILRENHWTREEDEEGVMMQDSGIEELYEENLKEINQALELNQNYLRVFAKVETEEVWFKEKNYLVQQIGEALPFDLKPEDKLLDFKIIDACFTNYAGIWFLKHFYL